MPTVQQLLTDVATRLQYSTNSFPDATVIGWMNDTQNEIWKWMSSTDQYQFSTIAGQALYTIPDDMRLDRIQSVQVSDSTVIDGTEGYLTYVFAGQDDELVGNQYFDALGEIGLYPVPSTAAGTGHSVKITYEPRPVQLSTSTLATVPSLDADYQDILKWRVLRDIARSGRDPDTDLANNYQADYDALFARIKLDYYKRKQAEPKRQLPYNDGWWRGYGGNETGSTST